MLTNNKNELYNHFNLLCHRYNAALRFASVCTNNLRTENYDSKKSWIYKVNGNIVHCMRSITDTKPFPNLGQLYVVDSAIAISSILNRNIGSNKLKHELIDKILKWMKENNPYAKLYKTAKEVEEKHKNEGLDISSFVMHFYSTRSIEKGRYNAPTADEIAGIYSMEEKNLKYELIVYINSIGKLKDTAFLPITSQHHDPCCYPLIFPYGHGGWHENILLKKARGSIKTVSLADYKRYYFHPRKDIFNVMHYAGKLLQQICVDSYIQVENKKISYLEAQMPHLYFTKTEDVSVFKNNEKAGKQFLLPSDFVGSDANMSKRFGDAMTLCTKYGCPDLFITFTANPKTPGIQKLLKNDQPYQDRPDIVVRSFNLRVKDFVKRITKDNILGETIYHFYAVEFQKRGLPHIHFCLKFKEGEELKTVDSVDKLVSAELPEEVDLLNIVANNMIHSPCNSSCKINDTRRKGFSKTFSEQTIYLKNEYPIYKRRKKTRFY